MAFLKSLWKNGSKHKSTLCDLIFRFPFFRKGINLRAIPDQSSPSSDRIRTLPLLPQVVVNLHITQLSDEWDLTPRKEMEIELDQPGSTLEGITFNVKYLGSTRVTSASSSKATAEAIKTIVNHAKTSNRKPQPVQLAVNLRGVSVVDLETKDRLHDVSLYRISYCSADATHGHVFAYIVSSDDEALQCHAFLCPKRKTAQLISITVAQTFNTAFHLWQMTNSTPAPSTPANESIISGCMKGLIKDPEEKKPATGALQTLLAPTIPMLIDLTTPIEKTKAHPTWTSFEE